MKFLLTQSAKLLRPGYHAYNFVLNIQANILNIYDDCSVWAWIMVAK